VVSFPPTRPPLAPPFTQWAPSHQAMSLPIGCPVLERLASGVLRLGVETHIQPLHKCHALPSRFNISKDYKCSDNRLWKEELLQWNRLLVLALLLLNRQA